MSVRSNITIAGQTAPGQGIATRGYQVSTSNATNVVIRYLRFRRGLTPDQDRDGVTINEGHDQIFDHVSVSWGRDENISINNSADITVQNSIISEGLDGEVVDRSGCGDDVVAGVPAVSAGASRSG